MRTDILLDETFDLIDEGDEWAEGESDQQHVELLTLTNKGELKEFPFVGFGAKARLNGVANINRFTRELKVELENDDYSNPTLIINNDLSQFKVSI
jgi:hypothetical protein